MLYGSICLTNGENFLVVPKEGTEHPFSLTCGHLCLTNCLAIGPPSTNGWVLLAIGFTKSRIGCGYLRRDSNFFICCLFQQCGLLLMLSHLIWFHRQFSIENISDTKIHILLGFLLSLISNELSKRIRELSKRTEVPFRLLKHLPRRVVCCAGLKGRRGLRSS